MNNQRLFQRIKFVTTTHVEIDATVHDATLVDLSLRGALVAFAGDFSPEKGRPCILTIFLDQSQIRLTFEGEIVHSHEHLTGIKFKTINIESMIHLRRLLELNSENPDRVRSELGSLIGVQEP